MKSLLNAWLGLGLVEVSGKRIVWFPLRRSLLCVGVLLVLGLLGVVVLIVIFLLDIEIHVPSWVLDIT